MIQDKKIDQSIKNSSPQTAPVDLDNARYADQKAIMTEIAQRGESPFLLKNLRRYHQLPILREGQFWYITPNQWPYDHTQLHFLIIAQQEWTQITDITPAAASELIEFCQWLTIKYQVPGGAFAMRFGDTNYSAGTVAHLHVQYIVPDIKKADYQPVRLKIGKDPAKISST